MDKYPNRGWNLMLYVACGVAALGLVSARSACSEPVTRVETLENGLVVALREDHRLPVVAFCLHVDGGARTETEELHGLSHYYEHTVFRGGTRRQPALATRKVLRELGDFSGYTSDDQTTYYLVVPRKHLDDAWWRYADALLGLRVTAEKIEQDRPSVLQEYSMRVADNPEGRAWARLLATAFVRHPYRIGPIGTLDVISTARLDRFKTFYRERYVPNQMVLAVAGDFETEDVLHRIRTTFGTRPRGRASFETGLAEPPQMEFREAYETAAASLAYGVLGFKVPELAHADTPVIALLDAVLAAGPSSRLERALRRERALAQELWSAPDPRRDPGIWTFGFACRPADEPHLVRVLLGELGRVAEGGVTAEELDRARELLERSHAAATETALGQATRLADHALKRALPLEGRWVRDLRSVSAEDVQAAARRYLAWSGATLVVVRPQESASAAPPSYADMARELLAPLPAVPVAASADGELSVETLPGGLRLALRASPGTGLASAVAAVRGGQWVEGAERAGAGALLVRYLTRGTEALDETALSARLDGLGARITATAEEDLALVRLSAPARSFSEALPLFLDVLLRPRLDAAAFETAKKEQLAAIAALGDDSFRETMAAFKKALYGASAASGAIPYGRPVEGEAEAVALLTAGDLERFHRRTYVPASIVVAAAGDLDPDSVRRVIKEQSSGLPGQPPRALDLPAGAPPGTSPSVVELTRSERAQTTFDLGRLAPGALEPQALALRVAARALGGRLFFRFVYEEALAYRMWTRYPQLLGPAPFYFEMGVRPADARRALALVAGDVARALATGLPASEVETAKRSLEQGTLLDLQTAERRAEAYARHEALGLGAAYPERIGERLLELTAADVNVALRGAVDPARSVLARVGPELPEEAATVRRKPRREPVRRSSPDLP